MAGAKVWIGVSYTNVSWVSGYRARREIVNFFTNLADNLEQWVYFMRKKTEEKTFYIIDTMGGGTKSVPQMW